MHRSTQIVNAAAEALQAYAASLGVSDANIYADRTLSLSEDSGELPAITVNEGSDDPLDALGTDTVFFIDSLLSLEVMGYCVGTEESEVRQALGIVRRYVQNALLVGQLSDLGFVISVRYGGAGEVELDTSAERIAGRRPMRFTVHYRMNYADSGD